MTEPAVPTARGAADDAPPPHLLPPALAEALRDAGWVVVRGVSAHDALDQMERRVDAAEARMAAAANVLTTAAAQRTGLSPGGAVTARAIEDALHEQVMASRAEVHRLYEPMVAEARRVANDSGSSPDARGVVLRLLELIGSRSR